MVKNSVVEKYELLVDVREPTKTFNILQKEGIGYKKVLLKTGDFVCEELSVCIERKTLPDFASSIIDGRLFEQVGRMKEQYKNCYILTSGKISQIFWSGMTVPIKARTNQVLGAMASIITRYKIPILMVDNDTQIIKMVAKIIEHTAKGEK